MESSAQSTNLDKISELFVGRWKVDRDENFEEFLAEIGVGYIFRKLIRYVKPSSDVIVEGDEITITLNAGFITKRDTFKLNHEFDSTFQGVKRKVTASFDDSVLTLDMVPYDTKLKPMQQLRERVGDELVFTMCVGNVRCKRYMKRLN